MKRRYVIPIFVPHMGCPHQCVFCDQRTISGQKGVPQVKETIEFYLKKFKNKDLPIEVAFYGGSFTAIPLETQIKLLQETLPYIDKGIVNNLRLSTRPDAISVNILHTLKEYYVSTIELGVQSMDDSVLKLSGRGHGSKIIYEASEMIKKYGIQLGIQLMPGLPGDSREKIFSTVRKVIDIKPDFVRIYPTVVIKGTPLEEMLKTGKYSPLTLEEAVNISALMYEKFAAAGITVIRTGLQPTEELLNEDCVIAGPFHSAFGELVKGEIAFRGISQCLKDFLKYYSNSKDIKVYVPIRKLSIYIGQKKKNLLKLQSNFSLKITILGTADLHEKIIIKNEFKNKIDYESIF